MDDATLHHTNANGIDFAYFEMGTGPLALCLHGYPDSAHTWRHLMPALADAGFRAVAPFLRGYAPSGLAPDGCYQAGAAALDTNALHDALGGDSDAVLVGHDWGALISYGAAGTEPDRWRRLATLAVPPGPVAAGSVFGPDQIRRSWYMFFQLTAFADAVVAANDFEYITRLWQDWSPGYDATTDVAHFVDAMASPDHVSAALGYYRQMLDLEHQRPELAAVQLATILVPPQPILYLHGVDDGCMGVEIADGTPGSLVAAGSHYERIDDAGHFLHLERPGAVNPLIVEFLAES